MVIECNSFLVFHRPHENVLDCSLASGDVPDFLSFKISFTFNCLNLFILNARSLQLYSLVDDCSLYSLLNLAGSLCPICPACHLAGCKQEDGGN